MSGTRDFIVDNRSWLDPYVKQLQAAMRMQHWTVTLKEGWPDETGTGEMAVWRNDYYYAADLHMHKDAYSDEELRSGLVHELVHLLTRDWDQAVDALESHITPAAWDLAAKRLNHEMEQCVDAIAMAWAETLPLPMKVPNDA